MVAPIFRSVDTSLVLYRYSCCGICNNWSIEKDRHYEFFLNNFGEGKLFPGGPKCVFKGKDLLYFVQFCDRGGMSCKILKEIFETLDDLELFKKDREEGKILFMLLDGHQ